jgi:hypothetical protein
MDLLRQLSLPARVTFLLIAGALASLGIIGFARGFAESDAQAPLAPFFAALYIAVTYLGIRFIDRTLRALARRRRT